jgi:hypothetical protein
MTDVCPARPRSPMRVADDGWRIPDVLWERIEPLLPPRKPHPLLIFEFIHGSPHNAKRAGRKKAWSSSGRVCLALGRPGCR